MPRRPRLHVPGGMYHVILRGNDRQTIFFDDDDRRRWESLIHLLPGAGHHIVDLFSTKLPGAALATRCRAPHR